MAQRWIWQLSRGLKELARKIPEEGGSKLLCLFTCFLWELISVRKSDEIWLHKHLAISWHWPSSQACYYNPAQSHLKANTKQKKSRHHCNLRRCWWQSERDGERKTRERERDGRNEGGNKRMGELNSKCTLVAEHARSRILDLNDKSKSDNKIADWRTVEINQDKAG